MKHPLSAEAFLDWVKRQPPEKTYDYLDAVCCPYGQFLAFVGFNRRNFFVGGETWWEGSVSRPVPLPGTLSQFPRTFGALAQRLTLALAEPTS